MENGKFSGSQNLIILENGEMEINGKMEINGNKWKIADARDHGPMGP